MSAAPRAVKRQVEEANRLLAALATKPGEEVPAAPAADPAAPAADPAAQIVEPTPPPAPAPAAAPAAEPTPPPAPQDDFRQKYLVLKGKYDKEIVDLKVANSELVERNVQLEGMLEQLAARSAPPVHASATSHLIKPEETAEYGAEFFDVVGRRAREIVDAELAPLRNQLSQKKQADAILTEEEKKAKIAAALSDPVSGVAGWEQINSSQNFIAWLADADVFSGRVKRELLTEAFKKGDAARVVQFFKAFQEDSTSAPAPGARTPSVDPGTLVAPGTPRSGGGPVDAPGGSRMWTQAEVSQFYAEARRGKIPAERKAQIEKEIIRAAAEGRVT